MRIEDETSTEETAAEATVTVEAAAAVTGAPASTVAPASTEGKKPGPGDEGFTLDEKPEQVHEGDKSPEQLLAEARQAPKGKAPHETWAKIRGMLPALLSPPIFNFRLRRALPGELNPKFGDYNVAKAHAGWKPNDEVTEEEFDAAFTESKTHQYF